MKPTTSAPAAQAASRAAVRRRSSPSSPAASLAIVLGSTLALPALAQPQPLPQLAQAPTARQMAPVTVTGTRQESRLDEQVAHITVIDRDEIERSTGRTLAEILSVQAGIQFSVNGGPGSSSAVYMRGLDNRHVLLLVDGIRFGSATSGEPSYGGLPADQIERIEIVRGAMSSLYGSDAVGGVVQVFTRRGKPGFRPHASASIGSKRFGSIAAGFSGGDERFDYSLTAQHQRNDGFSATNDRVAWGNHHPDDDGFRQSSLGANLGWRFVPGWQARLTLLSGNGRTELDDGTDPADPGLNSEAKTRAQVFGLTVEGAIRPNWQTAVRISRSEDSYDTIRSSSEWNLGEFRTTQDQYGWENRFQLPWGRIAVGLERLEQTVKVPPPGYAVQDRAINALWAGFDRSSAGHHLQASVRHDRNSQYGSRSTGTIGYGYDLTMNWRVGGSYGTSFVAPSFNELYYPGWGNPALEPEKGKQGEVFVRYVRPGHEVRLAHYQNRIQGYIPNGPDPVNVRRAQIDGWELSWVGYAGPWSARVTADLLDPRNLETGGKLPRRAKRYATAAVDRQLGEWTIGSVVRAADDRFDTASGGQRLGGFALFDLYGDWRLTSAWTVGARLNNLADRRYETAYGYNRPGREVYLTVRYVPG